MKAAQKQTNPPAGPRDQGVRDLLHFFWRKRAKIASYAGMGLALWVSVYAILFMRAPRSAEALVELTFRGMERGEYPSGRKLLSDDFRDPAALVKALKDARIEPDQLSPAQLSSSLFVVPIVPTEIQAAWKTQSQGGIQPEDFHPFEFRIAVRADALSDAQRLDLVNAVIRRYREYLKDDLKSYRTISGLTSLTHAQILEQYDSWTVPVVLRRCRET